MQERNSLDITYKVVVNNEGQYSIWPSSKTNPNGWVDDGFEGKRDECLKFIAEVWTDMRPHSVREKLDI